MAEIQYRAMTAADIGRVPLDCHGGREALADRLADLGSAAILAFDGEQHVGQLQFRRHDPKLRSPAGIESPDYWGDFGDIHVDLPERTVGLFCYHVGQLNEGFDRDTRYQGRGIGSGLLDHFLVWAKSHGVEAVVAKSVPSRRDVMAFMGGQPSGVYTARGFEQIATWRDAQLREVLLARRMIDVEADADALATVGMCVRRFSA